MLSVSFPFFWPDFPVDVFCFSDFSGFSAVTESDDFSGFTLAFFDLSGAFLSAAGCVAGVVDSVDFVLVGMYSIELSFKGCYCGRGDQDLIDGLRHRHGIYVS